LNRFLSLHYKKKTKEPVESKKSQPSMKLVIHNNFGSQNPKHDSFSNILYKTITYLSDVTESSTQKYNLATSSTKSLAIKNNGTFTLSSKSNKLIESGNIEEMIIRKENNFLGTTGFDIIHVSNANIGIHDFLMCGYSNQTARGLSRKFLKGNDSIIGSDADDYLCGYRGNDTIKGGLGADVLYGGHGKDHFIYNSISDSGALTATTLNGYLHAGGNTYTQSNFNDLILDFQSGKDKINLTKIGLKSKKSLSIETKTYEKTDAHPNSSYELWVDKDLDNYPDMVIGFVETKNKLKISDILI
jgi:hypothetical protein